LAKASIFYCSKKNGLPIGINDLCNVKDRKVVWRIYQIITFDIMKEDSTGFTSPLVYLPKLTSVFKVDSTLEKKIVNLTREVSSTPQCISMNPKTIMGSVFYVVCSQEISKSQRKENKIIQVNISKVVGVSEVSIRNGIYRIEKSLKNLLKEDSI
jgi:transcription initiation factor TFIIIB Brf1 subunit/transcription initiation factor TFIIB